MDKEPVKKRWFKLPEVNDFISNFRDVLRDTMLAHTLALLIISMYVVLEVRHPDEAVLGITFMIVFGAALLTIGAWLIACMRASYKKMIPNVVFKRFCIVFHIGVFETLLIGSIAYTAHSIVTTLSH